MMVVVNSSAPEISLTTNVAETDGQRPLTEMERVGKFVFSFFSPCFFIFMLRFGVPFLSDAYRFYSFLDIFARYYSFCLVFVKDYSFHLFPHSILLKNTRILINFGSFIN